MCECVCTCMYTHLLCVYVCMCVCVYVCTYDEVYMYLCNYVYIYICVHNYIRCGSIPTRVAAYNLLVELSTDCIDNMKCIAEQLIAKHHTDRPQNPKEWEVNNT